MSVLSILLDYITCIQEHFVFLVCSCLKWVADGFKSVVQSILFAVLQRTLQKILCCVDTRGHGHLYYRDTGMCTFILPKQYIYLKAIVCFTMFRRI